MFPVYIAELAVILDTPDKLPLTLAVPSKLCPHKVRAVCSFVAVAAFPVHDPDEPLTLPDTLPTKVLAIIVPSSLIVNKSV